MTHSAWPETNIVDLLHERAARHPERLALRFLHDGDGLEATFTYAALHQRAAGLAALLQAEAPAGSRALLLYPSGPEYVVALLACFYAGLVAVPAYPPQSMHPQHVGRIVAIAQGAEPRLILTEQALVAPLSTLKQSLPGAAAVSVLATDVEVDAAAYRAPTLAADRVALLQYTSGSTALPKGVMVSHGNLMANERAIQGAFGIGDDDVVVSWLPLFHDMGLIGTLLQPLYAGISAVLMAPQHFMMRPERWLRAVARHGGTVSGAPDFAYRLCVQRLDRDAIAGLDLSRWRLAFCGAEPVRAETLRAFADRFAPAGFDAKALYPCYGLAEATLIVSGGAHGSGVEVKQFDAQALQHNRAEPAEHGQPLVSCGHARPGHAFRIVDLDGGGTLPEGQIGEIQVTGPSVARGYWRDEDASARTFVQRDGQVYLRTGDLGFLHEGALYVTGRQKDMIIIRGQNLYPQDVERAVEDNVEVVRKGRTAAFSIERDGEEHIAVAAEINHRVQKLIVPADVARVVSEQVALAHGQAARVVLLLNPGALPVTSSGKLQRSACRKAWQANELDLFAEFDLGTN